MPYDCSFFALPDDGAARLNGGTSAGPAPSRRPGWLARLLASIGRRYALEKAYGELRALDARMLRDIGLDPHEVPQNPAALRHDFRSWASFGIQPPMDLGGFRHRR